MHELKTAGKPARLMLAADRTQLAPVWDDISYVQATVVDSDGVLVPNAADLITFSVDGPGRVVAVDSADNASHEPFQASERHAYQGRCYALVRASGPSGTIKVAASAPGLQAASATITAGR